MLLHLPLQGLDLLVQDGDHRDQGPDGGRVGGGEGRRLTQLLTAQRGQDGGSLARDAATAGALERSRHLGTGQLARALRCAIPATPSGSRRLASTFPASSITSMS